MHTGAATRLFEAAARVLRPGGELFTVYNSSLGYRAELTRLIGTTEQLSRTPKFTVTRSIRTPNHVDPDLETVSVGIVEPPCNPPVSR